MGVAMRRHGSLAAACAALAAGVLFATAPAGQARGSGLSSQSAQNASTNSAAASGSWTGTWSVSPQSGGASFNQQTLRQIVHTSIGGTSARVEISNVFGTQPPAIPDVHPAQRSSGSPSTA